jgi:hypothetical protein
LDKDDNAGRRKKVSFLFPCDFFLELNNKKKLAHPESEPGWEVTAAVTKKVIGAMTIVWHAPPPAPARVPARPWESFFFSRGFCFLFVRSSSVVSSRKEEEKT